MNRKPPYYQLDQETRRFAELVAYWAEQAADVQQSPKTRREMQLMIDTVCERLGLDTGTDDDGEAILDPDQFNNKSSKDSDVVLFPKFRLIRTDKTPKETDESER